VYSGGLIPEYPRLVIERGNKLHATWFVRHDAYYSENQNEIMYASGVSSAEQVDLPMAESSLEFISQVQIAEPAQTAITTEPPKPPVLEPIQYVSSDSLYTEYDEYKILFLSLLPAALILGVLILVIRRRQQYR
jgi:hypothetical protein